MAEVKCKEYMMNTQHISLGCQTGKVTDISHIGLYNSDTQAALEGRCYTNWKDKEQASCLNFSKTDSGLH
jgi:hypothetical protein